LAFLPPSGCDPLDLPHTSRCPAPLLGFVPLQRIRGAESTWLPSTGPNRPTTFRPQGFAPSRRLPPPPTFLHLSAKVTLVRFSLQGFPPSNRPRAHAPRIPLLAFLPRLGLSPPRTERIGGAWSVSLGQFTDYAFYRLQGLAPFESPLRASTPFKFAHRPIPSWASASLRFPHQCGRRIFTPSARVLPPPLASSAFPLRGPPPLRATAAPQRIWPPRQRPSLARDGYPSEVSHLPILTRVR